jgi:YD repeat-containing protein
MRSTRPGYISLVRISCVVLSYSLLLSLYTPFQVRSATPVAGGVRHAFAAVPGRPTGQRGARREGELLVRFRRNVSEQEKEEIAASKGARRGGRFRGASRIDKLSLPAGHDPEMLAAELRLNPAVEFAEPNYLIKRNEITPDDPRFGEQWALKSTVGAGTQAVSDIDAPHAWDVTTGAASTVIAVIDSGIDFTHPDLRRNQWANSKESENGQDDDGNGLVDDLHGWDWVAGGNIIKDEQGHGTIIGGIIAAQGNNAIGISGVMWRASLMSLRVLDSMGTGDMAKAVEAIDYAVEHGARVINCSWGTDEASEALKDAISRAARRGVVVVCSAGNDARNIDGTPYYPASFELDNLIAVASTDNSGQLTAWSNWGAGRIHVGAPGENILSTKMGGGYTAVSGSSASAPVVAGVAGLVRTARPYLSAKQTREMILAGAGRAETLTGKVSSGGIVNAAGALGALSSLPPDEGLKEGGERGHVDGDDGNNGGNGKDGGNVNGNGGHRPEPPIERTKGAPGLNLPNLDEVRKLRPAAPGAPAPIRSNLAPTCDPNDPNCDQCYGCDPTPTSPPPSSSPIGYLDGIGNDGGVWGWAFDPDAGAQSIDVHFYIDGPAGSGQGVGAATANQPRPDVNQAYGISGAHGYWFSIPPRFRDGQAHTLYVYGIDVTGNPNALLSAVPKSFTLSASGSITAGPNPIQVCDDTGVGVTTLSWSTSGTSEVDVRVGAPNGTLFVTAGPTGSVTTGKWVNQGMVFYLQNASYGDRTSAANTLATVTVGTTTSGCAVSCASAGPDNAVVDYSVLTHDLFAYGVQNAANVSFAVWGTTGGQNDLVWYQGQNLGGGTWKATVDFGNHYESGQFGAHVYMNNNSVWCDTADFTRTAPPPYDPTDPASNNFSLARLDPANRTGQPGTDLFSGNHNWSIPLVGLRGRAGLDLSVSLSYNSLVWTKDNAAIKYDADRGTPSAGFRLGFPVIESRFYNPVTNKNAYLMITPGGARVELRQVGSSNVYEAADSSYLQLIEGGTLTLRTTDGTQLSYARVGNAYRCTQVKDRNGNYLSVNYYGHGGIQTITDTLGRVVTFNYDGNNRPISITQTWNGATHTWATFGYGNISVQPGFSGLNVYGPQNQTVSLLTQVGLDDGTRYNFDYNTAGQVSVIRHHAADGHQLSYTAYDFYASGTNCPRVTARRDYAEDWNNGAEAVATYTDEGGGVRAVTMPDRTTVYKEFYVTAGWRRGLATRTETWSGGLQKWTTTQWTQDDQGLNYQLNPRPNDLSIYDAAGNRRRTTIDYMSYGLPENVREWGGANGDQLLRRTRTYYNLDAAYINRRIIGLTAARLVYEGESTLVAKTEFHYDWGGEYFSAQAPSVQHDGLLYGAGYLTGRGNLSAVRRFNKDAPDDPNQAGWQQLSGYNAAGLPVFARDADWHTAQISYADDYAGGNNSRNTLAYPTKVTDADGFSSTIRYNYDLGVATRAEGPPPAGHPQGVVTSTTYDSAGRVERVTNETSTAYTRFVYGADNKYVQSFSLLEAGVESYSIRVFDGAGRVRATAAGHPGSVGGFSAQFIKYDVMGRTIEQTNPGEITAAWIPAGDDAAGWVWSKQAYDWKGRPTVTTNVDGTTKEASYGGCGCAGGEVITLKDEVGRKQKVYADVLGRAWKSEDLNSDGSIYRTTTTTYNALDQVTRVYVQAGTSGTGQETSMTYDGFGRLSTKKTPIQTSVTRYSYNADDTVRSVTDAREAVQTIGYNARHLMTATSYSAPAGITPTAWVTFDYDAAGNRIWMDDEAGRVDYQYDQLSRLKSETRQFDGVGSFQLSYSYTLGGQLQSLTDPMGSRVSYNYDGAGRVNSMSGTGFGSVSTFASDMQYRAWGALKHAAYGNTRTLDLGYNARLQPSGYSVPGVIQKAYDYHADGSLRFSDDLLNDKYDHSYEYDQVGRVRRALSGAEARGGAATDDRPYNEQLGYDVWDHLNTRQSRRWNREVPFYPQTQNYTNDRNAAWQYDFDGNLTSDGNVQYTIDAAGHSYHVVTPELDQTQVFDGDGHRVKTVDVRSEFDDMGGPTGQTTTETRYEIRSSVLGGQLMTEVDGTTKQKQRTLLYLNGVVMGWQERYYNGTQGIRWEHRDVHNGSYRMTGEGGYMNTDYSAELDPTNTNAGLTAPASTRPRWWEVKEMFARSYPSFGDGDGGGTCIADGMARPCGEVLFMMGNGLAEQCPYNNCGPRVMQDRQGREYLIPLSRDPGTGRLGYNPRQWGYGTPPTLKFPGKESGKGNRNTSDASEGEESEPQKSYDDCKGLASIPEVAVNLIMEASRLEGTDPTLIAVTMKNESSFGNNLTPNPRKDGAGKPNGHYDVGWMQVATSVWDKSPYTDGLPNAYGTLSADWKTGKMLPFNGDALQNVRLGARALNASSGWRGRPKDVSPRADAAGIFRAGSRKPTSYRIRVNEFNKDYQAFDRFFNCLRGLPY